MLKSTQYSLELFLKVRRMARYSSSYLIKYLEERQNVNTEDATTIVSIAKDIQALEHFRDELALPFNLAYRKTGQHFEEKLRDMVVEEFQLPLSTATVLAKSAVRLDALDCDQTDFNHVDTMGAW